LSRVGLSKRRACTVMGISGSSLRYRRVPDKDASLRKRIRKLLRAGMGYRGAWADLRDRGILVNVKRVHRVWKAMKLSMPPKVRKRRTGTPMPDAPKAPGEVWGIDFVHERCLGGRRFRVLAVIDEFTRECLALEAKASFTAERVRDVLATLVRERGAPKHLRSDNGPEFTARTLTIWLGLQGTESRFIKPGSPWQNAKVESFNGKLRAECLDAEVFHNLADAQLKLGIYRRFHNEKRPHSSLGYLTPSRYREIHEKTRKGEKLYS
jgi:putative transposase